MNTASGPVEEQIFDIKHRRWPICYMLEGVDPDGIARAREYLSSQLQNAILMVMNSAHEAVEEAISRLTPEAIQFIERHRDYDLFWLKDDDVGRLGARWMSDAKACLLNLKLIRAHFDPRPETNRYVYRWTYTGKLVIRMMEPNFPTILPKDAEEKIELATVVPESQSLPPADPPRNFFTFLTSDGVRPSGGPLLTWLRRTWAKRP
jgi:hypothetical protein